MDQRSYEQRCRHVDIMKSTLGSSFGVFSFELTFAGRWFVVAFPPGTSGFLRPDVKFYPRTTFDSLFHIWQHF